MHQALLTHWHGDHVGGVADLKRLCPQVQVFKCALELDGESEEYARIEDGQVFRVEGATLKALFTPGHTEDHMAFVLEEEDAIFTGDSSFNPSPSPLFLPNFPFFVSFPPIFLFVSSLFSLHVVG